jgi:Xaa-Pro aminopeptidase
MLQFRTLTYVPIDTRLIDRSLMSSQEIDWLNSYHAECRNKLESTLTASDAAWLVKATAPI